MDNFRSDFRALREAEQFLYLSNTRLAFWKQKIMGVRQYGVGTDGRTDRWMNMHRAL